MNLLIRLFWIFFSQTRGRRSRGLFHCEQVHSIALPNDIDLNGHVNNGRLMTYIDIGRLDWLYKAGALGYAYRRRFIPVVGDLSVRYLKPLRMFERFTIESRLLGWNAQWGYFEHRIVKRDGRVALIMVNRGKFWSPKQGTLAVADVLAGMGCADAVSPPLPEWVQAWIVSLDALKTAASVRPMEEAEVPQSVELAA